jgi:hypothetical protein
MEVPQKTKNRARCCNPIVAIILATQEAEIRRIGSRFEASPGK